MFWGRESSTTRVEIAYREATHETSIAFLLIYDWFVGDFSSAYVEWDDRMTSEYRIRRDVNGSGKVQGSCAVLKWGNARKI